MNILLLKIGLVLFLCLCFQTQVFANESTLELDSQGKYRINTANIGKVIKNFRRPDIINLAIHTLGKGVDYVLDPTNNQVRFKKPVQKYDVVFCEPYLQPKCFETPEQLFAYYSQWNYGNNPGYRNPIYLNFFDKNNKNAIQLVQEGNLSEYAYIKYTVESNSLYNNIWRTLELEYQIKVMRKAGSNDNNNANQEQIVSFNELALELLLSANKSNRLAKTTLDKVNKGDKSSVVVTQPKPTQPKPPATTQPKPSNPPAKPITTPKPSSPPAKPANPPKPVKPIAAAKGNEARSNIVRAWEISDDRDANGKRPDRCTWLANNRHLFSADDVKATEKAWGCRHSRIKKDKKGKR